MPLNLNALSIRSKYAFAHRPAIGVVSALLLNVVFTATHASEPLTESVEELVQKVEVACPKIWEDLGQEIDASLQGSLWDANDPADQVAYLGFLENQNGAPADPVAAPADTATIVANCTAARTALLSKFYSKLPQDVVAAMSSLDYEPGDVFDGFEVGDLRHTGRKTAAKGWVFLEGQTIGNTNSSAQLAGREYQALFELAKGWAPNTGNEVWQTGDSVKLPNMSGRTLVGGSSSNIGTTFGRATMVMTPAQLPTHSHTMGAAGNHNHAVGNNTHSHAIRTSAHKGAAGRPAGWDYFGEARPRPGYQHTYVANKTIVAATHNHNLSVAGNHAHTINQTGGSQAFSLAQPSLRVRVEMKYK